MKPSLRWVLATALALFASMASAAFHTYRIEEIFSNADGTIQYIVMHESVGAAAEYFWMGHTITTGQMSYTFPNNLPIQTTCNPYYGCVDSMMKAPMMVMPNVTSTANTRVLIATQGLAALGVIAPDFIVPNGFIPIGGGTITYAEGADQWTFGPLPTDGVTALSRSGGMIQNVATNFSGQSAFIAAQAASFQGLWWASPAASESGWGLNVAHQGDTIFATWFTYDTTGKEWWLSMTANKTSSSPPTYSGQLLQTHGPAFSAVPFDPTQVTRTVLGNATLTFTDANMGSFAYSVTTASAAQAEAVTQQVKSITRQVFGTLPTCSYAAQANPAATTNYTDLWWASPAGVEAGWGINLTHEGTNIFATWFTYDTDGTPLWLSSTLAQGAGQTFSGALIQTGGPAFSSVPFDPQQVTRTNVGTATLTFADGNTGSFDYTAKSVTQHKAITRQLFNPPGATVCH
jgi:hypothetical protein